MNAREALARFQEWSAWTVDPSGVPMPQPLRWEGSHGEPLDVESIELWARLAADLAGMIQRPL